MQRKRIYLPNYLFPTLLEALNENYCRLINGNFKFDSINSYLIRQLRSDD